MRQSSWWIFINSCKLRQVTEYEINVKLEKSLVMDWKPTANLPDRLMEISSFPNEDYRILRLGGKYCNRAEMFEDIDLIEMSMIQNSPT